MPRRRREAAGIRLTGLEGTETGALLEELGRRCDAFVCAWETRRPQGEVVTAFYSAGSLSTCLGMLVRFEADLLGGDGEEEEDGCG